MIDIALDKEIISYVTNNTDMLVPQRCSKNVIQNHGWISYLEQRYNDFTSNDIIKESIYRLVHNIDVCPKCYCGNKITFKNNSYSKYCSAKCRNNDPGILIKNKTSVSLSMHKIYNERGDEIKDKRKETLHKKYNAKTSSPFSSNSIYAKAKETIKKRYEVDNILQLDKNKVERIRSQRKKSVELWKSRGLNIQYTDNDTVIIKNCCKIHGDIEMDINTFNNRTKQERMLVSEICTKCNPLNFNSGPEILLKKLLDEWNIKYESNTRKVIAPLELDFYLPDFKIAIEFNGLYYHTNKPKMYHLNKTEKCDQLGIQLIHIWENDWINNKDLIISMLKNRLHVNQNKIYARKCIVKELDSKTSKEFINKNHLQGNINSSYKFGLFYKDELVEVMTFGKSRRILGTNEGDETYELYRLCSKAGYNVIGGADKLFKYACRILKATNAKTIVTYAKRDWSKGDVYYKLGFKFIGYTAPGYFWANSKGETLKRYKTQRHMLDGSGTETQIMNSRSYFKCYDTGNLKFKYNL